MAATPKVFHSGQRETWFPLSNSLGQHDFTCVNVASKLVFSAVVDVIFGDRDLACCLQIMHGIGVGETKYSTYSNRSAFTQNNVDNLQCLHGICV